jgi:hypothetical protein
MSYTAWTPTSSSAGSTGVMVNNRRRTFRKVVLRDGVLSAYGQAADTMFRVVVVDIGDSSVGLRSRMDLPVGSTFWMNVAGLPDYSGVQIRITRCAPGRGAEYTVGAEFC